MAGRFTGTVVFYRNTGPTDDLGEIEMSDVAHAPLHVSGGDLRRAGAAEVGALVSFDRGVTSDGLDGAVNVALIPPASAARRG